MSAARPRRDGAAAPVAAPPAAGPSAAPGRGDAAGYGLTVGSYLLFGLTPILVAWAAAPESVLLVLRYVIAAAILLLVFARRRPLRAAFRPGVWQRFVLMGVLDSSQVLAYLFAVRTIGVAVATFVFFLQPVWVALLAPRFLRVATERVVYVALVIAFAGTALILTPSFVGDAERLSAAGLAAAFVAGLFYALFQIAMKRQTRDTASISVVTTMCLLDALFLLPLALWQSGGDGLPLTSRDLVAAAVIGTATTALAFTMWVEGVARVRVQHSSILGLITAVATPIYAYVLLGQSVAALTVAGGALILFAGALVVLLGRSDPDPHLPP